MSDQPTPGFDFREQLARIDRSIAETEKFQAETRKYVQEARKLGRDAALAPWQIVLTAMGAGAALFAAGAGFLKLVGGP